MTVDIEVDGLPTVAGGLVVEEQGEGFFAVLLPDDDRVFITNPTGQQVLGLCDGKRSTSDIVRAIVSAYPATDSERIRTEVHQFLATATSKGAVTW
jgi:hypothetical protein